MKKNCILLGPFVGELGWEIMRFSPILPYLRSKSKYQDYKFIVFTRPDRFDIYGLLADILVPLRLKNDNYTQDCYRLIGFNDYNQLVREFYNKYNKRFKVVKHIYPDLSGRRFAYKNQFKNQFVYEWFPRHRNAQLIEPYLDDRKIVVLAPRFRRKVKRNWKNWVKFYEMILDSDLLTKFNFFICAKSPDYIMSPSDKIHDINKIQTDQNSSLIGLTIELVKRAVLTVGSQSSIPNLSLMLKTQVLSWGHEKDQHTKTYNVKRTKIHFLYDRKYNISEQIIFKTMKEILKKCQA